MSIFEELQKRHEDLIVRQGTEDDILADVLEYIPQARKDSCQVAIAEEREHIRANLRYWFSYVYKCTGNYPNTELAKVSMQIRRSNKTHEILTYTNLLGLGVILLSLIFFVKTGLSLLSSPVQRSGISNGVDEALVEAEYLVFAGQIEDDNGRWLSDYVVVLFRNGEEISRTSSRLLDSPLSSLGPMDGVFELKIFNEYKLNQQHGFYFPTNSPVEVKAVNGIVGTRYIGTWFDNLMPGSLRVIEVPEKQLVYSLAVLPNPLDELPESYRRGNLRLEGNRLVTNVIEDSEESESEMVQVTAIPENIPVSQTNVQFTLLPSRNNGLDWHWQMTGYSGNRWDVWEKFVSQRNPGMSWETFEYSVLVHNPQLETDGFVFYPEKSYLLPFNQ